MKKCLDSTKDLKTSDITISTAIHGEVWDIRYRELEEYKIEKGGCNVPRSNGKIKSPTVLAIWVTYQREKKRKDTLQQSRVEKLEEIGFHWIPVDRSWDVKYEELLKYKIEKGITMHRRELCSVTG